MLPNSLGHKGLAVIETVIRNRCVPPAILRRLHWPDGTQNAVTHCTASLSAQGWLQSQRVVGPYHVVIPGRRAVRAYNLPTSYGKPLPRQTLEQNLGATLFCGLDRPKKRLLASELLAELPWIPKHLANGRPFLFDCDEDGTRRLAMIRVELGSSSYRIVKKHQNDLYQWCENRPFQELLDADGFMIVTIATTNEAAKRIAEQIADCPTYPRARVMAWPEDYLHLILRGEA
jgi:hypothetical protein